MDWKAIAVRLNCSVLQAAVGDSTTTLKGKREATGKGMYGTSAKRIIAKAYQLKSRSDQEATCLVGSCHKCTPVFVVSRDNMNTCTALHRN